MLFLDTLFIMPSRFNNKKIILNEKVYHVAFSDTWLAFASTETKGWPVLSTV